MRKEIDNNEKIKELIKEYQEKGGDDIFYLIMLYNCDKRLHDDITMMVVKVG